MTASRSWWTTRLFPLLLLFTLFVAGCGKPTLETITIEPASATLTMGQTLQLQATGLDKKGKPMPGQTFTWAVDGESGHIDANGLFTALKPGTATVTVTSGPVTRTAPLTVEREKVAKLATAVTPPEVTVGQPTTLTVIAQNTQGQGIADVEVQAQPPTQDTLITPPTATTDASGQATFTVTAARQVMANQVELRADGQQATVTVQGVAGTPAVLQVTPAAAEAVVGEEVRLQVTVQDEAGNPVPGQQVGLAALSEGTTLSPAEATTDAQGAASSVVRTSTKAGANRVRVSVATLPPQDIEIPGRADAPAHVTLQSDSTAPVAGGMVTVTIQVHDRHGNPVANTPLQLTAMPAAAALTATPLDTDASGTARVGLRTSPEAVPNTIQADVAGLAPVQHTVTGQTPIALRVTPPTASIALRGSQRFQAMATAASGHAAEVQPTWKVVGDTGTIAPDGTFTATQLGSDVIIATYAERTAGAQLTVIPGQVAQVQLMPAAAALVSGTTQQFQVAAFNPHGHPLEGTPTWEVTNNVGTVDASGLFTAMQAGSGEVVVKVGAITSRAQVTVTPGELATIVTSPESMVVEAGQELQLFANGQDAAGNPVPVKPTWRLTTNLGELTPTGVFRARFAGTGSLRVEAGARPVVAEIPVEVRPTALDRLEIQPPTLTLSAGEEFTFTAAGYDIFGNPLQVSPVWELTADLGSIDATGTLVAQRAGAMLVRATVERFTTQASVIVKPGKLASLTLEPSGPLTPTAGTLVPIAVTGRDAYGNTVAISPTWTQTTALGTLGPDGRFRAETMGTTAIVVQSGEQQATLQITITPGKLATLVLSPATKTLQAGDSLTFQATGLDVYDNPVPIQPVWRVADDIGEIDTTGRFSALQARTGQVVATAEGISGSAQVTVEPGPLTLLKVTPESLSLSAGDTADISVVGYDAFGNPIPAQPMWQITEGIGTITPDGRLTAQKAGEGRLVPVVGHLAGLVQLRVEHGEVATLQIEPSAMQMTSGRQQQFAVQGFDRGGNQVPVDAVSWSVEGNIGAIAAQGLFTATMAESGRVVAKVGPITATAEVRVEPGEATTLRLTPETARLKAGDTLALHPEAFDAAGNRVHTTPTWMVTEDLGIVSSESVFQARRAGSGKIIASLGAAQQAIDIQVHAGPLAMVVLTPSQLTLAAGGTVDFSAMGYDAYSNAVPVEPTWSLQGNIGQIDPATGILQASTAGSGTVVAVVGSIAGLAPIRVEPATAARLHLVPSAMTVAAGDTVSFTATVFDAYNNVTAAEITWSVTEARGDLVNGTFWARRPGPTAVVARVGEVQTQAIVQVEPGPAIRLHVAPEWRELPVGTTRQLRAYAHDAYDNVWQVSATWELTGEIGQLTPAGLFTAGKQGTEQVTASLGSLAASAEVSVVPGPLQRLVLTPGQTEMAAMSSQDFTALGRDAGGNAQPVTVRWAMTQGIGHLEPTGRFTAMQVGRGTVVAYTDTLMSTAEVHVTPGPVALLFVAPPPTAVRAGETIQFQVRGIDAQRNSVSPLSVQWSVTGDIGTVDASTGVFTAKWMGWGKVQATVAGTVGSADVEVQPTIPDADRSRLMSSRTTVLADGKTAADIIVLVRDRFGNPVSNAQVTLISSREDGIEQPGPSNQQGVAIGHVRSTTPGMSDITAVMESVRTSNSLRLLFSQPGVSG